MQLRYYAELEGETWSMLVDDGPADLQIIPLAEDGTPGAPQAADFSLVQAPGVYSLLLDGQSYEVYIEPDPAQAPSSARICYRRARRPQPPQPCPSR